jgi:hypothetical protein
MFNKRINLLKGPSRLLTKTQLQTMDIVYKAQPFVQVVTKNQITNNLDVVYKAQPFLGAKG